MKRNWIPAFILLVWHASLSAETVAKTYEPKGQQPIPTYSSDGTPVGVLKPGETVKVLSDNPVGPWILVQLPNSYVGYVSRVEVRERQATATPAPAAPPAASNKISNSAETPTGLLRRPAPTTPPRPPTAPTPTPTRSETPTQTFPVDTVSQQVSQQTPVAPSTTQTPPSRAQAQNTSSTSTSNPRPRVSEVGQGCGVNIPAYTMMDGSRTVLRNAPSMDDSAKMGMTVNPGTEIKILCEEAFFSADAGRFFWRVKVDGIQEDAYIEFGRRDPSHRPEPHRPPSRPTDSISNGTDNDGNSEAGTTDPTCTDCDDQHPGEVLSRDALFVRDVKKVALGKAKFITLNDYRTNNTRGLIQMPAYGSAGNGGACGTFHPGDPDRADTRRDFIDGFAADTYTSPLSACLLMSVFQDWKKNHCRDNNAGCVIQVTDIAHRTLTATSRPKWDHSSAHDSGNCIDFRPMRSGSFADESVTFRADAYSRRRTQEFVNFVRAKGASVVLFNDREIEGASPMRNHDNHLHVCFPKPTDPSYERTTHICENYKYEPAVCDPGNQ